MMTRRATTKIAATPMLAVMVGTMAWGGWSWFQRKNESVQKGMSLLRKGKSDKALLAFKKAQRKLGERPAVTYDLAVALSAAGKLEDAAKKYLDASMRGNRSLRIKARYNLGNVYYRMAKKSATQGSKQLSAALAALKKAGNVVTAPQPTKEQCAALGQAAKAYKAAGTSFGQAKEQYGKARGEYREVLIRHPAFFSAKWNLELALKGIDQADHVLSEAKRIGSLYAAKCQKKKKKNQKNNQGKQPKNQKKQQPKQKQQKKPSTQDMRRKEAKKALDRLEREQREKRRHRAKAVPVGGRPVEDW
ncbi:MAG: hypothetical protein J7M25_04035 [Deltaproteobacteria bacterium]|nr:hypothetical protein [Deltaproteobacteria bacterium]